MDAQQHGEIAGDHQPLDMVGVGVAARLGDDVGDAGHVGLARPVEPRQGPIGVEEVAPRIVRHLQPVDAAHEFPPAQDLADEAFDGVQRRATRAILALGAAAGVERIEQTQVDRGRDQSVPHPRIAPDHGVLPVAEVGQDVCHEVGEDALGLFGRRRPPEFLQVTEVIREQTRHIRDGPLRDLVGRGPQARGRAQALGQALAVLGVVVPFAADRLAVVEKDAGFATHLAIEELHPQLGLAGRPAAEAVVRADEAMIRANLHRDGGDACKGGQRLGQTPFAAFGDYNPAERLIVEGAVQFAGDGVGVGRIVDADVAHRDTARLKPQGEAAHGGEDQGDLLLVVSDVGGLVVDLGHQDDVPRRIETLQSGQTVGQLVAQHQTKPGSRSRGSLGHGHTPCSRHRSRTPYRVRRF